MKRKARWTTVLLCGVALHGCQATEDDAPVTAATSQVEPATSINAVMVGVVDHAAHHIWDIGRDGMAPQDDRDWDEVTHAAIQLIAAGPYLTLGGTGQMDAEWVAQPGWQGWARALEAAGVAALDAGNRRDLDGVLAAGDELIMACEGCHTEYKPDLPTEGIVHPHY